VNLAEFNQLCNQEWSNGRGEINVLYLSEASFDELYTDIFVNRAGPVSIVHPHWDLLNPITRQTVSVKTTDKDHDTMMVYYGGWKQNKTVVILCLFMVLSMIVLRYVMVVIQRISLACGVRLAVR
jgi:hypothetical protein